MTSINALHGLETPAPRSSKGVTIVIPVYNEENGVDGVMERLAGLDIGAPKEILAVNDGSTDATAAKLAAAEAQFDELRVVTHSHNKGYGAALKTGFRAAANDIVVVRAFYEWELMTPILSAPLANLSGNRRLLQATVVFRNEPFGD